MDKIESIPGATKIQLAGEGKVYSVVQPGELYGMTNQGWTVVGDYREHAVITHKPQGRDPTPTEKAAGAYGLVYDPQVHSFGEKQMFVVCRDAAKFAEEKAHAEQLADLRGDLADQQRPRAPVGLRVTLTRDEVIAAMQAAIVVDAWLIADQLARTHLDVVGVGYAHFCRWCGHVTARFHRVTYFSRHDTDRNDWIAVCDPCEAKRPWR